MLRVDVTVPSAELCTVAGAREHAGVPAVLGATEQLSETDPLKPATEVIVTVAVADWPPDTEAGLTADEVREKSGVTTAWRKIVVLGRKF